MYETAGRRNTLLVHSPCNISLLVVYSLKYCQPGGNSEFFFKAHSFRVSWEKKKKKRGLKKWVRIALWFAESQLCEKMGMGKFSENCCYSENNV